MNMLLINAINVKLNIPYFCDESNYKIHKFTLVP